MWIISTGDLADGFVFYGPFGTETEARDWAHGDGGDDRFESWESHELIVPGDDDDDDDDDNGPREQQEPSST